MIRKRQSSDFLKQQDGSILVEAALFMPILVMLLLLSVETSRFILVHQKTMRAANTVNDLLSRVDNPASQATDVFMAAGHIITPFETGDRIRVITSLVRRTSGSNQDMIIWQDGGTGTLNVTSRLGIIDTPAQFPNDFELRDNETVMVTEVFYTYEPLFSFGLWGGTPLYKSAFHKPRLQNLSLLEGES